MEVLQILPRLRPHDGLADYASVLAKGLSRAHRIQTTFALAEQNDALACEDFEVISLRGISRTYDHAILHFVNYGYAKRGVPRWLLSILPHVRSHLRGNLLTIFHELYASAPPWKSAFWLRPFQIQVARSITQLSDVCLVTNQAALKQLQRLCPNVRASVQPVFSNFGEPELSLDQIANRSPHRWVICGGTEQIERSLRSFRRITNRFPDWLTPRELLIVGGKDHPVVRSLIVDLANVRAEYHPAIETTAASQLLSSCAFGWIDYFHRPDVPGSAILKSSVFAALCAHGVIPLFPHPLRQVSDSIPARYHVDGNLPAEGERVSVAQQIHQWYQQHASSTHLTQHVVEILNKARD